jgi:hypothetical protein
MCLVIAGYYMQFFPPLPVQLFYELQIIFRDMPVPALSGYLSGKIIQRGVVVPCR